ncbi:Sialidase [Morchella snyderi]|nr:Sialidase [Morchella snyderi]
MPSIKSLFTLLLLPLLLFAALAHAISPSLDGAAVPMGGGTYPRATRLSDNSLLGVTTTVSSGTNIITIVRSTDNGLTWASHGEVTRGVGDIDNGFLLQLADGRILCAFRNHSKDATTGAATTYRITICVSSDNGATWSYLGTPETAAPPNGLWEPFMRTGADGRLQLYYSRELAADDQDNVVRFSADGGASWSASSVVSGAGITARDGMVGVARYSDGADGLIAVFETTEGGSAAGTFLIKAVTSADDGATWGGRQTVFVPAGTGNNAGAPQVANVGGSLVVSFMTDEDTGMHQWVGGAAAKIVVAAAGTVSWGGKLTVGGVQSNWPGLVTLDDSHVMVMYDNGGAKSQRVLLQ